MFSFYPLFFNVFFVYLIISFLSTKVDPARLFTVAPKLDASGIDDKGKPTRADLSLQ